jgi:collagen beta-1,O-galactosyltransferase
MMTSVTVCIYFFVLFECRIKSDHNNDRTFRVLKLWLHKEGSNYHNIHTDMDVTSVDSFPDEESPSHWSKSRFDHVISLRETALNYARNVWADFLLVRTLCNSILY